MKRSYYVPRISRAIIAALFYQAKHDQTNMVRLVNQLLTDALKGTPGWQRASEDWPELEAPEHQDMSPD